MARKKSVYESVKASGTYRSSWANHKKKPGKRARNKSHRKTLKHLLRAPSSLIKNEIPLIDS